MSWLKDIAKWETGRTLYLSVPFTWLLPKARALAKAHAGPVQAGGPAVQLMPEYLADVAAVNQPCPVEPLLKHNPWATFTTRGCPNGCGFCAVPRLEGPFRELADWRTAPVICDNNLLAAGRRHFDRVIDRLKALPKTVTDQQRIDFNQGLEARRLTPHHARRLAELRRVKVRFAFDHLRAETEVYEAVRLCRSQGLKDFGVYVLIGYRDTPEDALYRLEKVREWGIRPNPMRYQPLDALGKNEYLNPAWTEGQMASMVRYFSQLRWLGHLTFAEYRRRPTPLLDYCLETSLK